MSNHVPDVAVFQFSVKSFPDCDKVTNWEIHAFADLDCEHSVQIPLSQDTITALGTVYHSDTLIEN